MKIFNRLFWKLAHYIFILTCDFFVHKTDLNTFEAVTYVVIMQNAGRVAFSNVCQFFPSTKRQL